MESHASASTSALPPADQEPGDVEMQDEEVPMVDPATGQKILRPRNAWILYRKTRLDDVPPLPDGSKQPMAKASSIISHWWKAETREVRRKFELMAAAEKAEHKRRYPDYKYKPRSSHQIALAKEKKKAAKKIQAAKEKESKKAKQAEQPPPPLTSMAHTSYVEAALAAQATRPAVITHGPGGPSPPLSRAPSPAHNSSPRHLSEFEQGSSTTPATSHQTPSPGDMLGLSLAPTSFNFPEHKPFSRAPRHFPARIPPRLRTKRQVSGISTAVSSRVPSSSSLVILSPATSTSTSLSPLTWPPPSQYPSPQSGDESLASDLVPRSSSELYWGDEPSASNNTEGSGPISIDLEFNPASSGDMLGDIEYFGSMGLAIPENNEGVFQVPAAPFLDIVPGQIDVNLTSNGLSDHDSERFATMLNDFDFSAFQHGGDTTFGRAVSEGVSLADVSWESWQTVQQQSPSRDASCANEYPAHHTVVSEQPVHPTYQASGFGQQHAASGSMQTPQSQQTAHHENVRQEVTALSPEVLADPDFQAMFAGYLERKQKQNQQQHPDASPETAQNSGVLEHTQQGAQPQSRYVQSSARQPQQYRQQYHSPAAEQPEYHSSGLEQQQRHIQPTLHAHTGSSSEPSPTHSVSTPPLQSNRWVPPPGAIHSGTRRVAGSWRPPLSVEQERWSVPPSPAECAPEHRLPSWAGVPN